MAGAFQATIEIEDAEIRRKLDELIRRGGDLSPALLEIGEVLLNSTRERFQTEAGPDGQRWEENSLVTLATKTNPKILSESGLLGGTIAPQLIDGGRAVSVGSNRVYAAMMQFGGTRRDWPHLWGDIPARTFLGFSDQDREDVLDVLRDYLSDL